MLSTILERVIREEAARVFDSDCYECVIFGDGRGALVLYVYLWEVEEDFMNPPASGTIEQKFPYECIRERNFRRNIRNVLQYRKRELEV